MPPGVQKGILYPPKHNLVFLRVGSWLWINPLEIQCRLWVDTYLSGLNYYGTVTRAGSGFQWYTLLPRNVRLILTQTRVTYLQASLLTLPRVGTIPLLDDISGVMFGVVLACEIRRSDIPQ